MANSYQQMSNYKGSLYGTPEYNGIEYDWSVPDNLVVGSPGGTYSVDHHYTKGFYGRGETSGDIYAGEQQRYISGNYGNLYNTGQSAIDDMGYYSQPPDYRFWDNMTPLSTDMNMTPGQDPYPGPFTTYDFGPNKKKVENYSNDESFELIEPADTENYEHNLASERLVIKSSVSPWLLFLLFLMAFIAFDFWATAGHSFIEEKLLKGNKPNWIQTALLALFITIVFLLIIYFTGVPLTQFETL